MGDFPQRTAGLWKVTPQHEGEGNDRLFDSEAQTFSGDGDRKNTPETCGSWPVTEARTLSGYLERRLHKHRLQLCSTGKL